MQKKSSNFVVVLHSRVVSFIVQRSRLNIKRGTLIVYFTGCFGLIAHFFIRSRRQSTDLTE